MTFTRDEQNAIKLMLRTVEHMIDKETRNDELDRLLWACQEWFAGWKPNPVITDRRDRELYEAIEAMGPRLEALRDGLRHLDREAEIAVAVGEAGR